jgi:hypothetical protein
MTTALSANAPNVLTNIRMLFARIEDSFGVEDFAAADVASEGFAILGENVTFTPDRERLAREAQTSKLGQYKGRTGVQKGTKFSFKVPIVGLGGSGAGNDVNTSTLDGQTWATLLEACGFGLNTQQGTQLSAVSVTSTGHTTLTVDDASGIRVGGMVAVADATGALHPRKVVTNAHEGDASPAAGDVIVEPPLGFIAADNSIVYAATLFTQEDVGKYVSFLVIGDGYAYRLNGCRGILSSIELDAQKRAMAEFSFEVASFDSGVNVDALGNPSAVIAAAEAEQGIIVEKSAFLWGSDTTFNTPVGMGKLDPGSKITPKTDTAMRNAVGGFVHADLHPVLSVTPYFDHGWETEFDNGVARLAIMQAGYQAGKTVAIMLADAQVTKYPGMADKDGLVTHDVQLHGTVNPVATAATLTIALF